MDKLFGGKNPFDHPFFTHPFGGCSPFDDPFFTHTFDNHSGSKKQISIEELNPDDDHKNNMLSKEFSVKSQVNIQLSFSFQRVAYGGLDGVYYTSSTGRRTGGDGVSLMEMKEEDRTIGESLHTISKGIYDKGYSVTTKQNSNGRVDSLQTLHNLNEDEFTGFEENWKINADKALPGWNNFSLLENAGANDNAWDNFTTWSGWGGWPQPSLEYFGDGNGQPTAESEKASTHGRSKKVVPVE